MTNIHHIPTCNGLPAGAQEGGAPAATRAVVGSSAVLPLATIVVGERFRKDLGDLSDLKASIAAVGLLHPIVVDSEGKLVAGKRRVEACRQMGWETIPATVLPVDAAIARLAEADENERRLNLKPSEQVAVARFYAEQDRQEAEFRKQQTQGRPPKTGAKFAPVSGKGEARQKTAARAGASHPTVKKATEVVEAAEKDPALIPLVEKMDRTGKVDGAHKELGRIRRKAETAAKAEKAKLASDRVQLLSGTFSDVKKKIPDGSLDWIISDPPYPPEYLPLFSDLSLFAQEKLKAGGSLLALVGNCYLPDIIARLSEYLTYHWVICYLMGGPQSQVYTTHINQFWKPVLWFTNGVTDTPWVGDLCRSESPDKQHHEWGQSESGFLSLMERFPIAGSAVCDPFMGAGTTGVIALRLGARRFVGIDPDADALAAATVRLSVEVGHE